MTTIALEDQKHYQKIPALLDLIYGVINVRLSVDMGARDNRRAAPKKQIVLIKVKDIPDSLSVERHSSHVMLTLPPSLLSPLSLPVWQLEVHVKAAKKKKKNPKAELT